MSEDNYEPFNTEEDYKFPAPTIKKEIWDAISGGCKDGHNLIFYTTDSECPVCALMMKLENETRRAVSWQCQAQEWQASSERQSVYADECKSELERVREWGVTMSDSYVAALKQRDFILDSAQELVDNEHNTLAQEIKEYFRRLRCALESLGKP
jgi:hypothetical protein